MTKRVEDRVYSEPDFSFYIDGKLSIDEADQLNLEAAKRVAKTVFSNDTISQIIFASECAVNMPNIDQVGWAQKNNLYLPQNDLARALANDPLSIQVFDVREDDAIGGHVKGAVHYPEKHLIKPSVLASIALRALALGDKGIAVFHCMESLRRGPRSVYRLTQLFAQLPQELPTPQVRILEGGADGWIRKYWKNSLVESYDDEFWGYEEFPPLASNNAPTQRLYTIPDDGLSQSRSVQSPLKEMNQHRQT